MKILSVLCISCFIGISYAQEQKQIDQRLLDYHGDKIIQLYENNPDYYNFLVFDLDNSFYIIDQSDYDVNTEKDNYFNITSVTNRDGVAIDPSVLDDSDFNFYNYSFVRKQDERTIYDLGDGRLLVFYSLTEVKSNYPGKK